VTLVFPANTAPTWQSTQIQRQFHAKTPRAQRCPGYKDINDLGKSSGEILLTLAAFAPWRDILLSKGYFEFPISFAHKKMAKGRRNQNIHTAFSNFRQISAPGPSGNKLILTISFPPLDLNS
jgi:hypothetical protein